MLGDEFQNVAVEGFGLFPVDRVRGFGQYDELGAGDTSELGELKRELKGTGCVGDEAGGR
jgi:hypothetical protein